MLSTNGDSPGKKISTLFLLTDKNSVMKKHNKKIIAPVVITVILVLYLIIYAVMCVLSVCSMGISGIIFALIALGGIAVSIYTLIERINEIEKGEDDDISKY